MRAMPHGPARSLPTLVVCLSALFLLSVLGPTAWAQTTEPVDQPVTVQANQQNLSLSFTVYNDLATTGITASFTCGTSGAISSCVPPNSMVLPADYSGDPLPTTVHVRFNSSSGGSGTLSLYVTTTGGDDGGGGGATSVRKVPIKLSGPMASESDGMPIVTSMGSGSGSYLVTVTPPPPTYTVDVQQNGTPVSAEANSTSNTYSFLVSNNGNTDASYALTCSNTLGAGTCSVPSPLQITHGLYKEVSVTYQAGAAGTKDTVKLTASYGGYSDVGSIIATAYSHTVTVTPTVGSDGTAVTATANQNNTAYFTIKNTGTQQAAYTLSTSCPGTTGPCSLSGQSSPLTLSPDSTVTASVTYGAGDDPSTGSAHLTATYASNPAVKDDGWVNWTAEAGCQSASASLDRCSLGSITVLTGAAARHDTVNITNLTGFPLGYSVACQSTPSSGPITCSASSDPGLNAHETGPIAVTTTIGSTDGTATAHMVVTTGGDEQLSVSLDVEVLSPTSVVVSTDTTTAQVEAGDRLTHTFTVKNAGQHLSETFRLDPVCSGVVTQCVPSSSQVTLAAGASTSVSVQYVVSGAGGAGRVGLAATHIHSNAVTDTATAGAFEKLAPPTMVTTPYAGDFRSNALCAVGCFNATASYTTPAYTSVDVARAVTLVYSSERADPHPIVQVDVVDPSPIQANRISLQLKRPDQKTFQTFANGSQEMFFTNPHAIRRLAVQFDASTQSATTDSSYTLIATSYWDSTNRQTTLPIHVVVESERGSPYGVGWSIAGLEHLSFVGDSVLITDGTGSATLFRLQSCSSGCTYRSAAGDFTTLTKRAAADTANVQFDRRSPDGTTASFTTNGREAYIQDRFGHKTTYGYDGSNRLTTITDPVGQVTTLYYNAAGKLDSIADPMGRTTRITISSTTGDLTQIQDAAGGYPLLATYDNRHRLIKLTDRVGHFSNLGYDFAGWLAADTLPTITVAGQPARPIVQFSSPARAVLIDPSSGKGTLSNLASGVDTSTVRGSVTDPRQNVTRYEINRFGQATRIEEPRGRVSTVHYDDSARVVSTTAPSGHRMQYTWSGPDLIQTTDSTTHQTVHLTYESTYHQVKTVSGDVTPVTNYWSAGKLDSTRAGGALTKFTYDDFGRQLTSTDPMDHVTSASYATTGLRNRTSVTAAGRTTSFTPDAYGRVATTTVPDGGVTHTQYDSLNLVRQTTDPSGGVTVFTYDDALRLTAVEDAKGQLYQSTANALGWTETRTDPAGHADTVHYDLAGNPVQTIDRAHHVITATYDALNQVTAVIADGDTIHFGTDSAGRFVAASNAVSIDTMHFDVAGRPDTEVTVRNGHRYVRVSTYNNVGLRTKLAISGVWSATIGYAYDPITHQLDTLIDVNGGHTILGYNADKLDSTIKLPTTGGLTVSTSYPATHTISDVSYSNGTLNAWFGASYSYTPDGQIGQRIPADQAVDGSQVGREFQYDSLGRLTGYDDYTIAAGSEDVCGGTQVIDENGNPCIVPIPGTKTTRNVHSFAYDSVGNRTDSGAVIAAGNRLIRFEGDTLFYDLDGNLIERKRLSGGFDQTYHWNSLGQLTSVITNGATVSFTYDGFGRRVSKTTASGTTGYVYDGQNLLAELDSAGNRVAEYTYYPGIDRPHSVRRWSGGTSNMYYYATDLPNNVVGLINSSNSLVDHYTYTPFGTLEDSSVTIPNMLRFGAREFDSETGLYYNRARYYDPHLGRFISEDPIGLAGGVNLYAYAGNNPMNATDPTGEDCTPIYVTRGLLITYGDGTQKYETDAYFAGWNCSDWKSALMNTWQGRVAMAAIMTAEWATGTGRGSRTFGEGTPQVDDMRSSPGVNEARVLACRAFAATGHPEADVPYTFNARAVRAAGLNPTRQFVGSYNAYVTPGQDGWMEFTLENNTSFTSAFYHIVPWNWEQSTFPPMGNMRQVYTWSEPTAECQ